MRKSAISSRLSRKSVRYFTHSQLSIVPGIFHIGHSSQSHGCHNHSRDSNQALQKPAPRSTSDNFARAYFSELWLNECPAAYTGTRKRIMSSSVAADDRVLPPPHATSASDSVPALLEANSRQTTALFRSFSGIVAEETAASSSALLSSASQDTTTAYGGQYETKPARMAPMPMLVEPQALQQMQRIADALNIAVPAFVQAWHTNERLRSVVRIPEHVERLFLDNPPPRALHALGTMRPDLILAQDPSRTNRAEAVVGSGADSLPAAVLGDCMLRVCEINARFSLNGFLLSAHLNEALRVQSCTAGSIAAQLRAMAIPHMGSFVRDLRDRLVAPFEAAVDDAPVVWIIQEEEPKRHDLLLLQASLNAVTSKESQFIHVRFVAPGDLASSQGPRQHVNGNDEDRGGLYHAASGQRIRSCILELTQQELTNLSDDVLRDLLWLSDRGACLNSLRAVFLAHDKRLLSVLCGFYGNDLVESVLLPGESNATHRQTLYRCIVPTVPVDALLNSDSVNSCRAWAFVGGEREFLFKPALAGKGSGIALSSDFDTFEGFVDHLSERCTSSKYESSGIVQPFIPTSSFTVPIPSATESCSTVWSMTANASTVGTLLCMDASFYGPGIFRSKADSPIVALSTGGTCLPAALMLPEVPADARFAVPHDLLRDHIPVDDSRFKEVQDMQCNMRSAFANHGALLVTTDGVEGWESDERFQSFIEKVFGGVPRIHVAEDTQAASNAVWDVKPFPDGGSGARSHSDEPFDVHTDASWEPNPPRAVALAVVNADRCGGGQFSLVHVETILHDGMTPDERRQLDSARCAFSVPPEFRSEDDKLKSSKASSGMLPVVMGPGRVRFRADIAHSSSLGDSQGATTSSLRKFQAVASKHASDARAQRLLPEKCLLIFDNHRMLHARDAVKDPRRHLKRIRFDLPDQRDPQLDTILLSCAHGDAKERLALKSHPISTAPRQVSSPCDGLDPIYWSPSGQSGTARPRRDGRRTTDFDKIVGTHSSDNDRLREHTARAIRASGVLHKGVRCANLFSFGMLYRSGEIFGELFRSCDVTNLCIGSLAGEEALEELLTTEHFAVNALAGFSTHLIGLARGLAAKKQAVGPSDASRPSVLASIKLVVFGGEPLPQGQRHWLRELCHPDVQFLGLYGSSECGVFAFQTEDTMQRAAHAGCAADDLCNVYEYPLESAHLEIVPESGDGASDSAIGKLVVTNLVRRPWLVRYDTNDIASWVGSPGDRIFILRGRDKDTRRLLVGLSWIYFEEVVENVLTPLGLHDALMQLWLEHAGVGGGDGLEVRMLILAQDVDTAALLSQFEEFIHRITGIPKGANIVVKVQVVVNDSAFQRSQRSQKLIQFVDNRT